VTRLPVGQPRHHDRHLSIEKSNVSAQRFTDDVHVTAQSLAFLAQVLFGRERGDGTLEFLVRCHGWQNLLHSTRRGAGPLGHFDRQMLGKELDVGALPLDEHLHVAPGSLALLTDFLPQHGSIGGKLFVKFLPGRERRDGKTQFLFRGERRDGLGDGRVQLVPCGKGWQNLLHPREPAIEIFEMSRDHGVVHQPHPPEKDGGERTAILASSWRGNARAVKGPDGQEAEVPD
jgi:hypothetical protein